jgi:hypothetical protein
VDVNPGNGRALLSVKDMPIPDYHDLINAITGGPSVPGVASFHIEWSASKDRHRFHDPASGFDANVVFNEARAAWKAKTAFASYVSDPAATSFSLFAEVGHERNGVFFP